MNEFLGVKGIRGRKPTQDLSLCPFLYHVIFELCDVIQSAIIHHNVKGLRNKKLRLKQRNRAWSPL